MIFSRFEPETESFFVHFLSFFRFCLDAPLNHHPRENHSIELTKKYREKLSTKGRVETKKNRRVKGFESSENLKSEKIENYLKIEHKKTKL